MALLCAALLMRHWAIAQQPPPPAPPEAKSASALTFEVRRYDIAGNSLLSAASLDEVFAGAVGPAVTLPQIRQAVGRLQLAYRERGYPTVAVTLPQQQLTNGVVKVKVIPGVLADIRVTGNKHFSEENVRRALPSLRTNLLLNRFVFERELDLANKNSDRQIYPTLSPGPEPGTSALELKVKDRLPLHGHADLDNYSSPGTPEMRINLAAQYNNLWQREHQIGLSYGFTPQAVKSGGMVSGYGLNQPLIAYFGAFYRIPLPNARTLVERVDNSARFGYDEATHQFHLPPPSAIPDFTLYTSGSSSDTGVKWGERSVVSRTSLLSIDSQDSGQNLSENGALGGRYTHPLLSGAKSHLSFSASGEFKRYSLTSYNTNNFFITTVTTNSFGAQTNSTLTSSAQPVSRTAIDYFPISLGLEYSETDAGGSTWLSLAGTCNFLGDSAYFSSLAYSSSAKARFAKATLQAQRDQMLYKGWSLLLRGNAQAADGALINNEQFALGGINSVRGYYEGDEYGDAGWFGSVEIRSPFVETRLATVNTFVPAWLRASVFTDFGQRYLLQTAKNTPSTRTLLGYGLSLSANINNHFEAKIALAWPLFESANTAAGSPRANFTIGGQF